MNPALILTPKFSTNPILFSQQFHLSSIHFPAAKNKISNKKAQCTFAIHL
ncbi:hypothetical protein AQEC111735_04360 [Aquirufa ecclesiirivi]